MAQNLSPEATLGKDYSNREAEREMKDLFGGLIMLVLFGIAIFLAGPMFIEIFRGAAEAWASALSPRYY